MKGNDSIETLSRMKCQGNAKALFLLFFHPIGKSQTGFAK